MQVDLPACTLAIYPEHALGSYCSFSLGPRTNSHGAVVYKPAARRQAQQTYSLPANVRLDIVVNHSFCGGPLTSIMVIPMYSTGASLHCDEEQWR